ncbi:MAG: hypothetical protein MHM6MM_006121 [Cercozoa sp. M6MM]
MDTSEYTTSTESRANVGIGDTRADDDETSDDMVDAPASVMQYQEHVSALRHCASDGRHLARRFARRLLAQEVSRLRAVRGRFLCHYTGIIDMPGAFSILHEFKGGACMARTLRVLPRMPEGLLRVHLFAILHALKELHSQKVIHGRLAPDCVHTGEDGGIYVSFFGARLHALLRDHRCGGAVLYASPEALGGRWIDYSTDMWSLGCVALQGLLGRVPWDDGRLIDNSVLRRQLRDTSHGCGSALRIRADAVRLAKQHYNVETERPEVDSEAEAASAELLTLFASTTPLELVESELDSLQISANARDFLQQCFRRVPSQRPTPQQLLRHPWLRTTARTPPDHLQAQLATPVTVTQE